MEKIWVGVKNLRGKNPKWKKSGGGVLSNLMSKFSQIGPKSHPPPDFFHILDFSTQNFDTHPYFFHYFPSYMRNLKTPPKFFAVIRFTLVKSIKNCPLSICY